MSCSITESPNIYHQTFVSTQIRTRSSAHRYAHICAQFFLKPSSLPLCLLLPLKGRAPPNKPYRCLERFPDRNCCNSMIKVIITEIIQQCAEISVSRTCIFSVELAFRVIGAMPTRMLAHIRAFQILNLPGGRTYGTSHRSFF